jgi:hypothetical protein
VTVLVRDHAPDGPGVDRGLIVTVTTGGRDDLFSARRLDHRQRAGIAAVVGLVTVVFVTSGWLACLAVMNRVRAGRVATA